MKFDIVIAQFIPFILFYLLFVHSNRMVIFSNTPLGRLLAIALIIFYTNISIKYGFMFCVLIIFYYQMDSVEGMADMTKRFRKPNTNDEWDIFDWIETPYSTPVEDHLLYPSFDTENFANADEISESMGSETSVKDQFRQDNCKNGQLMHKGLPVKTDMADMVFNELEFLNERCNPCDKTCNFSIIEQKLKSQEDVTYPKQSDNWVNDIWKTWFNGNYQRPYAPVTTRPPPYSPINM